MSAKKKESLHFYDYLCHKIGSEKEVRVRRLTYLALDTSLGQKWHISSGSKGEGLDLKGSDTDMMIVDHGFRVYESEQEAVKSQNVALVMDTKDTQPCFTRLHLYTIPALILTRYRQMVEQHGMKFLLSNELYKQSEFTALKIFQPLMNNKIHGPCISDQADHYDFAFCLKCDSWISPAVPWIDRPRSSWISPEIISKITMSGVLFVPIGSKDSIYEDLEWRISFSVAEKFLIFSFNHTQLLCYALLKIVLKEIIEKDEDLKGLLCSYYLKTLMFWISDDSDPAIWRPENIIQCFNACVKRLLYCIKYAILLHYFIPDYNLLNMRLCMETKKTELTNLLKKLYQQGIRCFKASETLRDYTRFSTINNHLNINSRLVNDVLNISCFSFFASAKNTIHKQLHSLLHYSRTNLSNNIFLYYLSRVHQFVETKSYNCQNLNNKQLYSMYKYDRSHLLIGLHSDAVSGWLMLASFFYVHDNYVTSLKMTSYALSKITDEKCENRFPEDVERMIKFTYKQKFEIDMMEKETLITILKSLTINKLWFANNSNIIPKELHDEVKDSSADFISLAFAHFLKCLCFFRIHDTVSSENAMMNLLRANLTIMSNEGYINPRVLRNTILGGIAAETIGDAESAKFLYLVAAQHDNGNRTTAAGRLINLERPSL